jgi:histidine triad (HIT) family protein
MDSRPPTVTPDFCIFCAIANGQAPAEVVYEDEHTVAFMDINPATKGHVLVVPKAHSRDLFDVSEEDVQHVMRSVLRVARAIEVALKPDGLNLMHATRRAAFQSVYHFHVHVIPRWRDDGIRPLWRHAAGDPDELREVGSRIRQAVESAGAGRTEKP